MAREIYRSTKIVLDVLDDWLKPLADHLNEDGAANDSERSKAQGQKFIVRYRDLVDIQKSVPKNKLLSCMTNIEHVQSSIERVKSYRKEVDKYWRN